MKKILSLILLLSSFVALSRTIEAQGTRNPDPPVVKIMAIGHHGASPVRPEIRDRILPTEAHEAVKLYLAGKIDQWYFRKDTGTVIFIMNVTTVEEAKSLLESLPLGKAHILSFEYIPLSPMLPLGLLADPNAEAAK